MVKFENDRGTPFSAPPLIASGELPLLGEPDSTGKGTEAETTPFHLECWDGTYAYNFLLVDQSGDQLVFQTKGQDVAYLKELTGNSADWGEGEATFTVKKSDCTTSESKPEILSCHPSGTVTISGSVKDGAGKVQIFQHELTRLSAETKRVRGADKRSENIEFHLRASLSGSGSVHVGQIFPVTADHFCPWIK